MIGNPAGERDEDESRHAPGEAHHEGRDGSGLCGYKLLRHNHIDGNGEQKDEAAGDESGHNIQPAVA